MLVGWPGGPGKTLCPQPQLSPALLAGSSQSWTFLRKAGLQETSYEWAALQFVVLNIKNNSPPPPALQLIRLL